MDSMKKPKSILGDKKNFPTHAFLLIAIDNTIENPTTCRFLYPISQQR